MTTSKKVALIVGCLFLASGLATWLYAQHILRPNRWTVLEQPIRLEDGFSLAQSFTVGIPTDYFVEIECQKTVPFETLKSILTEQLAVSYSVAVGERSIADGDSSTHAAASSSQDHYSRFIGSFPAIPRQTYHLNLRVTRSLPQLASTSPVAKVSVTPLVFKNAFVTASLLAYLAIGLAIVGLLCAVPVLCSLLFRRRK